MKWISLHRDPPTRHPFSPLQETKGKAIHIRGRYSQINKLGILLKFWNELTIYTLRML